MHFPRFFQKSVWNWVALFQLFKSRQSAVFHWCSIANRIWVSDPNLRHKQVHGIFGWGKTNDSWHFLADLIHFLSFSTLLELLQRPFFGFTRTWQWQCHVSVGIVLLLSPCWSYVSDFTFNFRWLSIILFRFELIYWETQNRMELFDQDITSAKKVSLFFLFCVWDLQETSFVL